MEPGRVKGKSGLKGGFGTPPKGWFNAKFENGLNKANDVMTKHLTQSFVDLRGLRLTTQPVTELCFDHAERRLDIAALVIPLEKELAIELIIMKCFAPKDILFVASRIGSAVWSKSGFDVIRRNERTNCLE